ncbi:TonB-dependent receptor [uncultured Draconibacterium sp.]|uniref:TonB-dependent receptor n=1 Tax=uncultured Draconibacterium sp. TaxID=1573823 RepID=UPI00326079C6
MKLIVFIICFSTFGVLASNSYSQVTKLSLNYSNTSIQEILVEIEESSEFYFLYNNKLIDVERKVNIDVENKQITEVLDKLFSADEVSYSIMDRQIVLTPISAKASTVQQQKAISGTIVDENSQPLPGVTVIIKGTTNGTVTGIDGNYTLTDVPEGAVLQFSFVGMRTQEIEVGAQTTINITMMADAIGLQEVVAIGYGTTTVKDATGAVSSVRADDFNKGFVASPEQLIQGRSAGVQITSSSGEPGAAININIRGTSSVRSGNNPLYVVDGVALSGDNVSPDGDGSFGGSTARNPLNFLNPDDIKDISILKDASATAIYGSRGANGVVIITTKSGKGMAGGGIEYSTSMGVSTVSKRYDVLEPEEYLNAIDDLGGNSASLDAGYDTDWQDQIYRTGISQTHNLSYSSSSAKGDYRASMSYFKQNGIIEESSLERFTARINGNRNYFDDKLKFSTQLTVSNVKDQGVPIGNTPNHYGDLIASALYMNPTEPVYLEDGSLNQPSYDRLNPLAMLEYSADNTSTLRALLSLSAEYQITKDLSIKTIYGYDMSKSDRTYAYSPLLYANGIWENGRAGLTTISMDNGLWENFINYKKTFDQVVFTGLLGYSYQFFNTKGSNMNAGKFRFDDLDLMMNNMASGESIVGNTWKSKDELQSYFARLNFVAKDKWLVTATVRADGSTRFGTNNKYGYFPSMALGYRLSEEDFIPESISNLKIRLGWGITGNQEIPHNLYSQRQRYGTSGITNSGDINIGTLYNVTFANPDLQWETTKQFNGGIDFGFNDNKIRGTVDFYHKTTTDLLIQQRSAQPAPQSYFWTNLDANIINAGVDFSLSADLISGRDFSWEFTSNLSYNKNEVKDFATTIETGRLDGQGLTGVFVQRIANNQPMYAYFLRIFEGFDSNGLAVYKEDKPVYTGDSPIPKVSMGLTNTFRYKNFDCNVYLNGQFGHKIYSNTANAFFYAGNLAIGRNVPSYIVGNGEAAVNTADPSTRFLEDGSFVRLQDVTLGYNIPVSKIKNISKLRLSLTGQNLFVITDYSGQDPEVNVNKANNGVPSLGIDYTTYPRSRTILMGLSVQF